MLLLIDAGEDHGYTLYHGLLARGIDLQATTVYRWLAKFDRDGWVLSSWSEPIDGPRRHVYRLTAEGRAALREMTAVIAAMRDRHSTFLDAHAQAVARRRSSVVDEAATPITRDAPVPTPDVTVDLPPVPSAQRGLRPHRELLVGWLLLQLDAGATYGYDLRRAFDAQRLSPDPGAMYRMLRQLEADKWVQSRWMNPAAGPRRRFYRLTGRGRRNLDEIARLIAAIRDAHEAYLVAYEHARDRRDAAADSEVDGGEP
ncbi:MAG: helix-turn-helix transcriptional regulator [Solirubrobacteraceae bacterium]|nr:helix-turn-helix transcriptional regulator [Solirubrobacteraceae bacterium]